VYCVNCGVKLADTEKECPLCRTVVFHPALQQEDVRPLYPKDRKPKMPPNSRVFNGVVLILFLIHMLVCFLSDIRTDGVLNWFGFVCGALVLGYIAFALPFWFRRPNPVIFVPCTFAATVLYLLYIDLYTNGGWFLRFAFPVVGVLGVIVCAVVTLMYYLRRGYLYILGGGLIALGAWILLNEFLLMITFSLRFIGWSIYPLIVLTLLGGALIYLAIDDSARKAMERKLFI